MEKNISNKKYMITISLLLIAAFFVGCATNQVAVLTSEQMAAQGIDETALRRGRALAMTECTECHRFYRPHEYSPEQWPGIIERMGRRASLSGSQIEDVRLYFVTMSRPFQLE
jgi:mono/diheme cytochrome c family protein